MLELLFIMFVDASLVNLWDSERLQRDEAIQRKCIPVMTWEAVWLEAGCSRGLPRLMLDVALKLDVGLNRQSGSEGKMQQLTQKNLKPSSEI